MSTKAKINWKEILNLIAMIISSIAAAISTSSCCGIF